MKSVCIGIGMIMGGVGSGCRQNQAWTAIPRLAESESETGCPSADAQVRSTYTLANTVLNQNLKNEDFTVGLGTTKPTTIKKTPRCRNKVNVVDQRDGAPLIDAIFSGRIDLVDELLTQHDKIAKVSQLDHKGFTPLMAAAQSGNAQALSRLLDRCANLHAVDRTGRTVVSYLEHLQAFSSLNVPRGDSLHSFLKQAFIDRIQQEASSACGIDVETYEDGCRVAYNWAQNHPPKAQSVRSQDQGVIMPYHVYQWVYNRIVRLRASEDLVWDTTFWDMTFEDVQRILDLCCSLYGEEQVFQALEDGEEVLELHNRNGMTALMLSVVHQKIEDIKLLLKAGVNTEACDYHDQTALIHSVQSGNEQIIKLLLDAHANVNHVDFRGHTPILIAYLDIGENSPIFNLLVAYGANYEKSKLIWKWAWENHPRLSGITFEVAFERASREYTNPLT